MKIRIALLVLALLATGCQKEQTDRYTGAPKAKVGDSVSPVWFVDARTGNCIRIDFFGNKSTAYLAEPADCAKVGGRP